MNEVSPGGQILAPVFALSKATRRLDRGRRRRRQRARRLRSTQALVGHHLIDVIFKGKSAWNCTFALLLPKTSPIYMLELLQLTLSQHSNMRFAVHSSSAYAEAISMHQAYK